MIYYILMLFLFAALLLGLFTYTSKRDESGNAKYGDIYILIGILAASSVFSFIISCMAILSKL